MKTVLGIDPGYGRMGYGVISVSGSETHMVEAGCIETPADMPFEKRLATIYDAVAALIKKHAPEVVGVEELFFSKNVKTAVHVAHARGAILLACEKNTTPTQPVSPNAVKEAVTGYGKADKQQVQLMTKTLLGLSEIPKPDDAADALAIAIAVSHAAA